MADTDEQNKVEGTTEPMLSSDKPEEATQNEATQESANAQVPSEPKLPEEVKDRTKEEFDKLLERNRALAEENASLKTTLSPKPTSLLDEIYPSFNQQQFPDLPKGKAEEVAQKFVDAEGYVDVSKVSDALAQAQSEAQAAREDARQARQEVERHAISQDLEKAYIKHPYLDPDNEAFDENFYNLVRNEVYGQAIKHGKKETFVNAAQTVLKVYNPQTKKAESVAAQDAKTKATQEQRQQATTSVGATKKGEEPIVDPDLVEKSQKGDRDAIYKRLQASGN